MKKDAFYFPHFCNARHDRKIKRVLKELGIEGYGIYFMLLEVLREQVDFKYPLEDIDLLADEFGTSEQKVRTVICNYQLFEVDGNENFFSIKQIYYLQPYIEKTERARNAAKLRWENTGNQRDNANVMQMHNKCNADAMQGKESKVKESKGKERKVKESKIAFSVSPIGTIDSFRKQFLGTQYEIANFEYYHEIIGSWAESKNEKKVNWVAAARNWMARDMRDGKFITQNFVPNESHKRKPTRSEQLQAGYEATLSYYARRNGNGQSVSGQTD